VSEEELSVSFFATCPTCQRRQLQSGYSRASMQRLVDLEVRIDGYCEMCDQSWPIDSRDRAGVVTNLALATNLKMAP
jgi:hypothetical protein